jgi:hypothetical protein
VKKLKITDKVCREIKKDISLISRPLKLFQKGLGFFDYLGLSKLENTFSDSFSGNFFHIIVQQISYIFDIIKIIDKSSFSLIHSRKHLPPNLIIFKISKQGFQLIRGGI